jgi:uncharacterized protein (DUF58 family)
MDDIQTQIRKLRLTARRLIHTSAEGSFRTMFHGRGIEFAALREYVPGDDIRQIEWNTTARRGAPYIKTFVEERDLSVILAIDLSSSMRVKESTLHRFTALLTTLAAYHEDRIGCLGFADKIEFYLPPSKHTTQPEKILHRLLSVDRSTKKTAIGPALAFLHRVAKKHALLFVISDFLDRNYEQQLLSISRKHEMVGIHLFAGIEKELPRPAIYDCFDPESGKRIMLDGYDASTRVHVREFFHRQSQSISRCFGRTRADLLTIAASPVADAQLLQFLHRRQSARVPLQVRYD